ncbi:MAG TPA: thymidine kinase [Burkholderiaceae bacterium]
MAKLYFRYAAMNAGKSTAMLQVAHNYEEQGRSVALYTAAVDDRYGLGKVTSRLGIQREARVFDRDFNFLTALTGTTASCVLLDEAQFLTADQVVQLHRLAQLKGVPVICYGLRTDFQGKPFEGAAHLLSLADDIEEMKTICLCGRKATMNIRVDGEGRRIREGEQVSIGGNASYKQACAKCFYAEA